MCGSTSCRFRAWPALGKRFVLQGGTQHNLAAVKAQVDYIKDRVPGAEVYVHPHTGEAGAIGAAMETLRVVKRRGHSTFIGLDAAIEHSRTPRAPTRRRAVTSVPTCVAHLHRYQVTPDGDTSRYIAGFSCEKGTVESEEAMLELTKQRKRLMKEFPNLVDLRGQAALFGTSTISRRCRAAETLIDDVEVKKGLFGDQAHADSASVSALLCRGAAHGPAMRIGIPRVLNMWSDRPFLRTYFETLGIQRTTWCFPMRRARRCGRRAASTARSTRAIRRRWRRRTFTTCCFTSTAKTSG
jgi:hypothetical protein